MGREVGGGNAAEVEPLAAGDNGGWQLLQFGGGKNEYDVLRRFFQRFEQRVEGADRQHMHLVNDIHAVFQLRGGVNDLVADIADVIHAVVGGGVHLQHVGGGAAVYGAAGGALAAGTGGCRVLTVDRLCQYLGAGCLACSARAAEQVRVRKMPRLTFVFENGCDLLLPAYLVEVAGAPLPVQCLMHNRIPPLIAHKKRVRACRTANDTEKPLRLCRERRPYTPSSDVTPRRSLDFLLRTGDLAAHTVHRLMLLDSSPDMVHGSALRKTHSSTQEKQLIPKRSILRRGINPCYSGFQVQGAADSPAGMACFHGRKRGLTCPYYSILPA